MCGSFFPLQILREVGSTPSKYISCNHSQLVFLGLLTLFCFYKLGNFVNFVWLPQPVGNFPEGLPCLIRQLWINSIYYSFPLVFRQTNRHADQLSKISITRPLQGDCLVIKLMLLLKQYNLFFPISLPFDKFRYQASIRFELLIKIHIHLFRKKMI